MPQGKEGAPTEGASTDESGEAYNLLDVIAKCDARECGAGGEGGRGTRKEGIRTKFVCRQRPVSAQIKGLGGSDVVDVSVVNVPVAGREGGLAGAAAPAGQGAEGAAACAAATSERASTLNGEAYTAEEAYTAAFRNAFPLASCETSSTESEGGGRGGGGGGAWSWSLATKTYTAPSFGQLLGTKAL